MPHGGPVADARRGVELDVGGDAGRDQQHVGLVHLALQPDLGHVHDGHHRRRRCRRGRPRRARRRRRPRRRPVPATGRAGARHRQPAAGADRAQQAGQRIGRRARRPAGRTARRRRSAPAGSARPLWPWPGRRPPLAWARWAAPSAATASDDAGDAPLHLPLDPPGGPRRRLVVLLPPRRPGPAGRRAPLVGDLPGGRRGRPRTRRPPRRRAPRCSPERSTEPDGVRRPGSPRPSAAFASASRLRAVGESTTATTAPRATRRARLDRAGGPACRRPGRSASRRPGR